MSDEAVHEQADPLEDNESIRSRNEKDDVLRQDLNGFQIFFIVISTVIGSGIFSGNGEALRAAGPGGLMLAITVVGLVTIAMLEGLSEMIQLYAAPNALVQYVRYFVDEDLAALVGFAYWYSYASVFQVQAASGASFASVLNLTSGLQIGVFYVLWPLSIVCINLFPVKYFGWIESLGGALKLVMITAITCILFYLAGEVNQVDQVPPNANPAVANLGSGFQNGSETLWWLPALCLVIEFVTFSFIGVEVVGVTAYEARDLKDLRRPSKVIGYIALLIYLIHTFSEIMAVNWQDARLASISNDIGQTNPVSDSSIQTLPVLDVAAVNLNDTGLRNAFTGMLIYSSWSASNITLYLASRTLYGLARNMSYRGPPWSWLRKEFGTGVPSWCVIISAVAFWWIPLSQIKQSDETSSLHEVMAVTSSICIIFVWGAICLAYLRYYIWLKKCRSQLKNYYARYDRWNKDTFGASTLMPRMFQPWLAGFGLTGCFVMMFVFTTSLFWIGNPRPQVVVSFMVIPTLLVLSWLLFKLMRYMRGNKGVSYGNETEQRGFWWVNMSQADFLKTINKITYLKDNQVARDEIRSQTRRA